MSSTPVTPVPEVDPFAPPSETEVAAMKAKASHAEPLTNTGAKTLFRREEIKEAKMLAKLGPMQPEDSARAVSLLRLVASQGDTDEARDAREFLAQIHELPAEAVAAANAPPVKYTRAIMAKMPKDVWDRLKHDKAEVARMRADLDAEGQPVEVVEDVNPPAAEVTPATVVPDAAAEAARVAQEAATQEAVRVAAEAEVARIKEAEAETARQAEAQRLAEEAAKPKQKIVREYQIRDEQGRPIGKPTHLEADTWEEMSAKQEEAHANAMRYAERVKNRKPTPAPAPLPTPLTEPELVALQNDLEKGTPAQKAAAIVKIAGDQVIKDNQEMRAKLRQQDENQQANEFVNRHKDDYNACYANNLLLGQYLVQNKMAVTADNLDIALEAILNESPDKLAPVPRRVSAPAPAPTPTPNPAPAAVATIPAAAAPVPVPSTPAPVPASVVPAPAAPAVAAPAVPPSTNVVPEVKPPTADVQPGQLTGVPAAPSSASVAPKRWTEKMLRDLPNAELQKRMKNPDFVARVNEDLEYERTQKRKR